VNAPTVKAGQRITSTRTGSEYVLTHIGTYGATWRRAHPKVRGKAARKAEREARRRSRGWRE
jgi:hypothetical protein